MKNKLKWFGIIALVAIIGISITACGGPSQNIYEGIANAQIYSLVITQKRSFTPDPDGGDIYKLTFGMNISEGEVISFNGTIFNLKPSVAGPNTFNVTVSGNDLAGFDPSTPITITSGVNTGSTITGPQTLLGGSFIGTIGSGWPSKDVRDQFGIGNMNAPSGPNFEWGLVKQEGIGGIGASTVLSIKFINYTPATTTYITTWFTNNGWTSIQLSYWKDLFVATYDTVNANLAHLTIMSVNFDFDDDD